ncbi:hypothetical protein [uncultured Desulfovibrio sp.]|uniref:hypothetical protein n=1 Tax=uncultured Desulfovibrio sp. TaxID=167968 RepID=UPI0032081A04
MAGYWRTLYETMREDLQSPAFRQFGSYSIGGRSFSYRSLSEFRQILDWVEKQAALEDGVPTYRARRQARNGGRG